MYLHGMSFDLRLLIVPIWQLQAFLCFTMEFEEKKQFLNFWFSYSYYRLHGYGRKNRGIVYQN